MGEELVSVIIPTYNRLHTLPKAIQSVLNQSYRNIELLIVDDCSTDGTKEYVESLQDDRVRYIRNEQNIGAGGSRNRGVQKAKGEYVAFQDSDDEWTQDKIKKQMQLFSELDDKYAMVYSAITRYYHGKILDVIPLEETDLEQKSGDLFEYLLFHPLVSPTAMIIKKNIFCELSGFKTELKVLEDYEFSIRVAEKYKIGFVNESLVDVCYDAPDSVNKHWREHIITQFYIIRKWFQSYDEGHYLWDKLLLVKKDAEELSCLDVFENELDKMKEMISDEEYREGLELLRVGKEAYQNNIRLKNYESLLHKQDLVVKLYSYITNDNINVDEEILSNLKNICRQSAQEIGVYEDVDTIKKKIEEFEVMIDQCPLVKDEILKVVERIYGQLSEGCEQILRNIHICNACGNQVIYNPIPSYYKTMREKYGFIYKDSIFQLESEKKYYCPVCQAADRDRLMIAFMEMIQPENEQILRMLQIAPAQVIEDWALKKDYIEYESTDLMMPNVTFQADIQDMNMIQDSTYDIVVCSHVLEHVREDYLAMKELYRVLKPEGVCLVLVPLIVGRDVTEEEWGLSEEENWRRFGQDDHARLYGRKQFVERLQNAGFTVNELGEEWFGQEFYQRHGFDENSILYVVTKGMQL